MRITRTRIMRAIALTIAIAAIQPAAASALPSPNDVQFDLRGCNLQANEDLVAQNFICQDYANGNFGKDWAELDLVPHRLTVKGKQNNPGNTLGYTFVVAGDEADNGEPAWDDLSTPQINAALSDASCQLSNISAVQHKTPGAEGADTTIYRTVDISHKDNVTCVIDWYQRLALGSAAQPGSSLHSYMLGDDINSKANQTLSIPVQHAQGLSKTMDAQHHKTYPWNLTKTAPATVDFPNPCNPDARTADIKVKVSWERLAPVDADTVRVVTNITAVNPAQRPIDIDVTDVIRSGNTVLDTYNAPTFTVPANTTTVVATHTFDVPVADATNLNDIATASYSDPVTGTPIAGTTTATANAQVVPGGFINAMATIEDNETITGTGLSFSVGSVSAGSATGIFRAGVDGLLAGPNLTLPTADFSATNPPGAGGTIYWRSDSQAGSGFVEFNKTISLAGDISTTGSLSDTATLEASDGFAAVPASASTAITAKKCGKIVIDKDTVPAGSSEVFSFTPSPDLSLYNGGSNSLTATDSQNDEVTVPAGTYNVSEDQKAGWTLTDLSCTDGDANGVASSADKGTRTATYNVDPGETVTCRYVNTQDPGPTTTTPQSQSQGPVLSGADTHTDQPGDLIVQGERVSPGSARLAGATGCRPKPFTVRVKGKSISRVEFSVDGKKRKTVSRPDSAGRYKFKIDPRKFKKGSHKVVARAVFDPESGTRPKSMTLRFSRCVRAAQAPAFTG